MERYLKELLHISDEALLQQLLAIASLDRYEKNGQILEIGQVQDKIQMLISGAVRFYYLDETGREHTQCFVTEPGYPVMVDAYMEPSFSGCHALKETLILSFPMVEGFRLVRSSRELTASYVYMLRKCMLFHAELAMVLRAGDAHRRYMWFCSNYPGLEEVAKSRHIASLLCITPETLSRVRGKAKKAEKNHGQMTLDCSRDFEEVRQKILADTPISREQNL